MSEHGALFPRPQRLRVQPLTPAWAAELCTWRYPAPYDVYDIDTEPAALLNPDLGFHAVTDGAVLVGFRSFGVDGRVPGWGYDDEALDTGGGLRPDLLGQGLGRHAIEAGLAFGRALFSPPAFRVTIAWFNARALRTVESVGFVAVDRFEASTTGREFVVLVRPER